MTAAPSLGALASRAPSAIVDDRPGSYHWWYFDALSADGDTAVVAIFFVGSVFSPHYKQRFARGEAPSPFDHVALNLAVYRRGRRPVFVFSEYDRRRIDLGARSVAIAGSWFEQRSGGAVEAHVDDVQLLTGKRVRGTFEIVPELGPMTARTVRFGEHDGWFCPVPRGRVRARFPGLGVELEGLGYHDTNFGSRPPSASMQHWSWGRVHDARGGARVFFDVGYRDGRRHHTTFDSELGVREAVLPARRVRPSPSCWLLPLPDRFDCGPMADGSRGSLGAHRPLERGPFYYRFVAPFPTATGETLGIAEHVDFDRVESPVVWQMVRMRLARPDRGQRGLIP
jgi:carotenoid 1,2-hydratase